MTTMVKMAGNTFHCTATLKPAPHLEPINYDPWAQLEFIYELTIMCVIFKALKKQSIFPILCVPRYPLRFMFIRFLAQ